jgi:hypothetical protein
MEWVVSEGDTSNRGTQPQLSAPKLAVAIHAVLLGSPSILDRLVYIASLHSPATHSDLYVQFTALGYSVSGINKALLKEHRAIFADWLSLSLEQKLADLEECALLWGLRVVDVAHDWLTPPKRDTLIPLGALAPEVELFHCDLELLLPIVLAQRT